MLCLMIFRLEIAFRGSIYEYSEKSIHFSVFILSIIFCIFFITSAIFLKGDESTIAGDDIIQCNGSLPMVIAGIPHITCTLLFEKQPKGPGGGGGGGSVLSSFL